MKTSILLIHGLFGCMSDHKIVKSFGAARIFAPDLIGYGAMRVAKTDGLTLESQADHVALWLERENSGPVHVVGHSVGGAVAAFFVDRHPNLTRSLTSIEGNFSLKDAFWSGQIAKMNLHDVEAIIDGYKADVRAWIGKAGVDLTPWTLSVAEQWLNNQPASTIRAQARAVVEATGKPDYLEMMHRIYSSPTPVHLIAGERSRKDWDLPDWALEKAASSTDIAAAGHLMMLEAPERFAATILQNFK